MSQKNPGAGGQNALGVRYLTKGPPGLVAKVNELIRCFDYLFPRPSGDVLPEVTPGGSLFRLRSARSDLPGSVARTTTAAAKFELYAASATAFGVTPGLCNGVMATLGGVALDASTPPTATVAAQTWVWLKCVGTFSASLPDSYVVTIETGTTSAVPAGTTITATGFVSYKLIGVVNFGSGAITTFTQRMTRNQGVESMGATNYWWTED